MIPNGKYIFNLAVLFPIVFRMGLTSLVFSRFQLYLSLFYVVAISCTVSLFDIKSRIFYKIYVITISVCSCYQIVTSDYRYIPYTNYFVEKMFGKEYLYDERSNYNKYIVHIKIKLYLKNETNFIFNACSMGMDKAKTSLFCGIFGKGFNC
mgnify:CR=1 FL=1